MQNGPPPLPVLLLGVSKSFVQQPGGAPGGGEAHVRTSGHDPPAHIAGGGSPPVLVRAVQDLWLGIGRRQQGEQQQQQDPGVAMADGEQQGGGHGSARSGASAAGECFGLLGVNGAGKTTTFRMVTGKSVSAVDAKAWSAAFACCSTHPRVSVRPGSKMCKVLCWRQVRSLASRAGYPWCHAQADSAPPDRALQRLLCRRGGARCRRRLRLRGIAAGAARGGTAALGILPAGQVRGWVSRPLPRNAHMHARMLACVTLGAQPPACMLQMHHAFCTPLLHATIADFSCAQLT